MKIAVIPARGGSKRIPRKNIRDFCGKPIIDKRPQAAHRIGYTKANLAKYGSMVVDHVLNVGMTCSLECNSGLDIWMNPVECLKLCRRIYDYELRKRGVRD